MNEWNQQKRSLSFNLKPLKQVWIWDTQDFTATVITLVLVHRCRSTYQSCTMRNKYTIYWLVMLGSMIRFAPQSTCLLSSRRRREEASSLVSPWCIVSFQLRRLSAAICVIHPRRLEEENDLLLDWDNKYSPVICYHLSLAAVKTDTRLCHWARD